jgi:hypothetical protein
MNQYEHKHYYYPHQDPYKLGYWEEQPQPLLKEVTIGVIIFIVVLSLIFVSIESVLFLN